MTWRRACSTHAPEECRSDPSSGIICPDPCPSPELLCFQHPDLLTVQIPGTIITVLSFGAFWLDVSVSGERIGFGSTMLLTILLLMTIVGESVPKCGE
jgi:hypothetical protein